MNAVLIPPIGSLTRDDTNGRVPPQREKPLIRSQATRSMPRDVTSPRPLGMIYGYTRTRPRIARSGRDGQTPRRQNVETSKLERSLGSRRGTWGSGMKGGAGRPPSPSTANGGGALHGFPRLSPTPLPYSARGGGQSWLPAEPRVREYTDPCHPAKVSRTPVIPPCKVPLRPAGRCDSLSAPRSEDNHVSLSPVPGRARSSGTRRSHIPCCSSASP